MSLVGTRPPTLDELYSNAYVYALPSDLQRGNLVLQMGFSGYYLPLHFWVLEL